jgi:hypothetical protein
LYVTSAIHRISTKLLTTSDSLYLGVMGACLILFLAEILLLPGNLIRLWRRRSERTTRVVWLARGMAVMNAALNLAFVVSLAVVIRETMSTNWLILAFGLPAKAALLFVIPPLAAVLAVGMLALGWWVWKKGTWTVMGRIHYTMVTLAALAFAWLLIRWFL